MTAPPAIRRLSQSMRGETTSLPPDLLAQSCRRVSIASLLFAAGWGLFIVIYYVSPWLGGLPNLAQASVWPQPGITVATAAFLLSVGMALLARRLGNQPTLLLDVGLAFLVVTAALIGFLDQWVPSPLTGDISWICAIILMYPAIAPAEPRKALIAAVFAASMDPLWYAVAIARDAVLNPSVADVLFRFWPNYLCAVAATVPAHIIRGLGRQVHRARALGSYQLGPRLGSGGMGEVYHAEHRLLARPAAIKLIRPDLLAAVTTRQADMHVERFRREAEAAALLRSPHTIELYDFGFSADGGFYYVMELLDGISFEDLVERFGPVPAERAVNLMLQVCESIGEAHARGMIHRDLKPANLFTCRVGMQVDFAKVLDFGLVKGVPTGDPTLTAPNIAAGTPAFMAPEVALGEPEPDGRIDVYSLGCVLYWLLTGQLVFEGKSPGKVMHRHIQESPPPPSSRTELEIPPELDAVVLACLAKEPAGRPANAHDMRAQLAQLGIGERWTRDRAQRWWETHNPHALEPCEACNRGRIVPALSSE